MSANLSHIVLVDDNETTSFLNNRLLGRLAVADRVSTFSRADEAFEQLWGHNGGSTATGTMAIQLLKLYVPFPSFLQPR